MQASGCSTHADPQPLQQRRREPACKSAAIRGQQSGQAAVPSCPPYSRLQRPSSSSSGELEARRM